MSGAPVIRASQRDRDRDRAAALALYLLRAAQRDALARAIYDAAVASAQAALDDATATLGMDGTSVSIPDAVLSTLATSAQDSATSCVSTYNAAVSQEAAAFATDYTGPPEGLAAALRADLAQWADARAAWKAEQIAAYETARGYAAGLDWLVNDLQSGTLALPDGTQLTDLTVTVRPSFSSDDTCAEYAGQTYPLSDYDSLPAFPIHINCIHWRSLDAAG